MMRDDYACELLIWLLAARVAARIGIHVARQRPGWLGRKGNMDRKAGLNKDFFFLILFLLSPAI